MDWLEMKELVAAFIKKYRWAVVVLLAGILLMLLPEQKEVSMESAAVTQEVKQKDLQQELEEILSKLDGAGKVKVLLSQAAGAYTHYQMDEDQSKTMDTLDKRSETVIITGADRSQSGLVQRVDPPTYLGAVVLCQGGDSPAVKLAVVDAVATATGLTSDKISVWKMK